MPTGYTHNITETMEFRDFALQCARAFGACIEMRDDPVDTPIPDEFQPNGHYKEAERNALADVEKYRAMTVAEAAMALRSAVQGARESADRGKAERFGQKRAYQRMLSLVRKWTPPTAEHEGLRKFMEEQIVESIKWDCGTDYYDNSVKELEALTPETYLASMRKEAERQLAYYRDEHDKEVERARSRTQWVKALRESLK